MSLIWLARRGLQLLTLLAAGVFVALVVGAYAESRDNPLVPSGRWLGWLGYTILLVAFVVHDHRCNWRRSKFWFVLVGLISVHAVLYVALFQAVHVWRGLWFFPLSIVEYAVALRALRLLGYRANG